MRDALTGENEVKKTSKIDKDFLDAAHNLESELAEIYLAWKNLNKHNHSASNLENICVNGVLGFAAKIACAFAVIPGDISPKECAEKLKSHFSNMVDSIFPEVSELKNDMMEHAEVGSIEMMLDELEKVMPGIKDKLKAELGGSVTCH